MADNIGSVTNYTDDDLGVFSLLRLSERYNEMAKGIVIQTTTVIGSKRYKKLIYLSIKALMIILKKYDKNIEPKIKALVLLKLSKILFEETQNFESAEKYANECLTICKRNNLTRYEITANILLIKILKQIDPSYCSKKLNELCHYQDIPPNLLFVFTMLKYQYFGELDSEYNSRTWRRLLEADDELKVYYILLSAQKCLSSSELSKCCTCLKEAQSYFTAASNAENSTNQMFLRLKAIWLFMDFFVALLANEIERFDGLVQSVGVEFVKIAQNYWTRFSPGVVYSVPIKSSSGEEIEFDFCIDWLCKDQFSILFYLYYGLATFYTTGTDQTVYFHCRNSKPLLDRFNQIKDNRIKLNLTRFESYYTKCLELRYTSIFYERWYRFLSGEVITVEDLKHEKFSTSFQQKFSEKVQYLNTLQLLSYSKHTNLKNQPNPVPKIIDFNLVISNLKDLSGSKEDDIRVYSLLQLVNVLNWKLDLADRDQDFDSTAEALREIKSVCRNIDDYIGTRTVRTGEISGSGFVEFIRRNFELQSVILSLVVLYEISSSWSLNARKWLKAVERSKVTSVFPILLVGLTRSLLSEKIEEFSSESNYIGNKVKAIDKSAVPLYFTTSNLKDIAFYSTDAFKLLLATVTGTLRPSEMKYLKRLIVESYRKIGELPQGLNSFELLDL